MKNKIISSIIASVVAITTITSVACTTLNNQDNFQVISNSNMVLYDDNMDYISTINDYITNDKELSDMEYKKAVYMYLYNTNVSMDEYKSELHTLLLCSINPSCVDNFDTLFVNLINALNNKNLNVQVREELSRVYLPLAAYFHELECNDPSHLKNYNPDINVYECDTLKEEYRKRSR